MEREIHIAGPSEGAQTAEASVPEHSRRCEYAPVAYFSVGHNGAIRDVNNEGAHLLACPGESLINGQFDRFVHADDMDVYSSHLERVFRNRSKQVSEVRLVRCNGEVFHARLRSAVAGASGLRDVAVVIVTDISDFRESEKALRESEQRYRELVNLSPDGIGVYDHRGDLVFVNDTLANILGYVPSDLIGTSIVDLVYQDSREVEVRRFREMLDRKAVQPFMETLWVKADGTPLDVEVASAAVFFRGEPAVQMVVRDVTERREAREDLRRSELRFRHVHENVPVMMHSIDTQGRIVSVNKKWLEVTGYALQEVVGRNVEDFMTPESRVNLRSILPKFWRKGKVSEVPYQYVKKDGTVIDVLLDSVVMDDPEWGRVSLSAIRDVTAQERAEEELRKRTFDLSERIKELNCLYGISELVERQEVSLEEMVSRILDLVPRAWQDPASTTARIVLEDREFKTDNFIETQWKLSCPITVNGKRVGTLDVCRLKGEADGGESPFLDEERRLVDAVAERLGRIVERNRAESALRLSEERFRAVFESAEEYISIKDRNLKHVLVNPAMEKLLARKAADIVGLGSKDLLGEQTGTHMEEVDRRVLNGDSIEEERTIKVHGIPLTLHFTTVPLKDGAGDVIGICTMAREITARKRIEPELSIRTENYQSQSMQVTLNKARVAAETDSIVLLQGESGSGKDFLARWIHDHSLRAQGPFFTINCAAVARELAESELFGHERGAFTGAVARKKGILELAEGGTLLLNEIGELDLSLQAKLLAFLDTRSFLRVGGQIYIHVNARLIAATHRNLDIESAEGRFLRPLLYRLSVFPIDVPALRERKDDIPLLAEQTIQKLASEMQLSRVPVIDADHVRILKQYHWPGNVRELRNVLERSLMLWRGERFGLALPVQSTDDRDWSYTVGYVDGQSLREVTDQVTKSLCSEVLQRCRGNKKETARILGISRDALYRYMRRMHILSE
ncbi:MAG: PAS domain S-box protein [Pseudomonadota bacterium]